MAWMKWFKPIPYPSPSPPVAITVIDVLVSLHPVANGSARPCRLCTPYERKKPGRFDEQPIPDTTRTLDGSICRSAQA